MRINLPEEPPPEDPELLAKTISVVVQIREMRTAMKTFHGARYAQEVAPYLQLLLEAATLPEMHGSPLLATVHLIDTKPDWADARMVLAALAELEAGVQIQNN